VLCLSQASLADLKEVDQMFCEAYVSHYEDLKVPHFQKAPTIPSLIALHDDLKVFKLRLFLFRIVVCRSMGVAARSENPTT
jgi:hypothetical protein